jgi:hypothetical protein
MVFDPPVDVYRYCRGVASGSLRVSEGSVWLDRGELVLQAVHGSDPGRLENLECSALELWVGEGIAENNSEILKVDAASLVPPAQLMCQSPDPWPCPLGGGGSHVPAP